MICKKEFRDFLNNVFEAVYLPELTLKRIFEEFDPIAHDLKIGLFRWDSEIPSAVYSDKGFKIHEVYYENPDGYSNSPVVKNFSDESNNQVSMTVYPCKDCIWTKDELDDVIFVLSEIYILVSRARLFEMVRNAEETDFLTASKNNLALRRISGKLKNQDELKNYNAIFFNLRDFKGINHKVGAKGGDQVLVSFSKAVRDFLRDEGFFFRLGGDNFIVLIRKYKTQELLDFTSRMSIPVEVDGKIVEIKIDYHAGVAEGNPEFTVDPLLGISSMNMKIAKKKKKQVIWEKQNFQHEIKLSEKDEDNSVLFQPKIDLATGSICGAEVIPARMNRLGVIKSTMFAGVESESPSRSRDFILLEEACKTIRRWLDTGVDPVPVSVSFSRVHFYNENLEKEILGIVGKYGINPKFIEIQIAELSDYKFYERFSTFIKSMQRKGFHIVINDFGTGYASLNILRTAKIDGIRIAPSLVSSIKQSDVLSAGDDVIISFISNLGHQLGIYVIANGLEKDYQAKYIKKMGCSIGQGSFFDAPMPLESFSKLLVESKTYIY